MSELTKSCQVITKVTPAERAQIFAAAAVRGVGVSVLVRDLVLSGLRRAVAAPAADSHFVAPICPTALPPAAPRLAYLSVKDAARLYGVSKYTLYEGIRHGSLYAVRRRRGWVVSRRSLDARAARVAARADAPMMAVRRYVAQHGTLPTRYRCDMGQVPGLSSAEVILNRYKTRSWPDASRRLASELGHVALGDRGSA